MSTDTSNGLKIRHLLHTSGTKSNASQYTSCLDYILLQDYLCRLHVRRVSIRDLDLELLARTRGKDLRILKIMKCNGKKCVGWEMVTSIADTGLQVIGQFCKKLRKFKTDDSVTQMELITMVKGCLELECLHIHLKDITNEILECIGTHLKNLRDFQMTLSYFSPIYRYAYASYLVDNGIRAMLTGCSKLERL
ncbi:coronatine-insensitive 1, partial [Tanacetum coccineum]